MLQLYLSMVNNDEEKTLVEYLYTEYKQLMYKTAFSVLHNSERAEDAVHEAFVRVINNLSKFSNYSCKENISYLVIIVKGIALNMLSDLNKTSELNDEIPDNTDIEKTIISNIAYKDIVMNIKSLSPALKNIAYLFFVENCSATEISELLDINVNTVYSSISRARKILTLKHTEINHEH